ncbi:NAD-dependent epimerase/dehydratase family protein [Mucilaginibacter sp. KACC 22773]|uniref:NAD-dependent epimerase/dehydratase family protein n=1 Tax=Mucilaginibacter sp. KACC 22773 TaxID=3025671 RepID=UPI002365DE5D|nr:NAD-dependent epimerase/dehydratase family protein [Mucilaginibacter sp. KACC 22773]WDF77158.1 NAD-dependent epimerase/dehydratase family protein [Mucilaginibacter sp. KACC 22773]
MDFYFLNIKEVMKQVILIIGAAGQLGTELTTALRLEYGRNNVIAANKNFKPGFDGIELDVLDTLKLKQVVCELEVTQIYLLAALLSATGEQQRAMAWKLNVQSLLAVLEIARECCLEKVFWPSSIAVFGPGSPRHQCPQETIIEPNTVYGISKRTGEYWCNYYFEKFGVDVRSLRYPGLISYLSPPGGGTTDYAVDIFHQALEKREYSCFLKEDTCLPMMYMKDAIRATMELMHAPKENISVRTSYNIAAMSFAPCDLAAAVKNHLPDFKISYEPDYRQGIADSWPASICDTDALRDWGWKPGYQLTNMTEDMLQQLARIKEIPLPGNPKNWAFQQDFPIDNYVFTKLTE